MGFLDFFRPEWKHSDPQVRLAAIKQMDASQEPLLKKIAQTDSDSKVRRVALKLLDDPAFLLSQAIQDSDQSNRALAQERAHKTLLQKVLSAPSTEQANAWLNKMTLDESLLEVVQKASWPEIRQLALHAIQDNGLLARFILSKTDPNLQTQALTLITEQPVLKDLVINPQLPRNLAMMALPRITEDFLRKEIALKAPKFIREMVKASITTQQPEGTKFLSPNKKLEKRSKLCQNIETALQKGTLLSISLEQVQQDWVNLGEVTSAEELVLQARFSAAVQRAQENLNALQKQRNSDLFVKLQEWVAQLNQASASSLYGLLPAAKNFWNTAKTQISLSDKDIFTTAYKQAYQRVLDEKRYERCARVCQQASQLMESDLNANTANRWQTLQKIWEHLSQQGPVPEKWQQEFTRIQSFLTKKLRHTEHEQSQIKTQLTRLTKQVSQPIYNSRQLETLTKQIRNLESKIAKFHDPDNKDASVTLRKIKQQLRTHNQEFRMAERWKLWANAPKLEQICLELENLAQSTHLKDVYNQVNLLTRQWREIGATATEKMAELKQRFQNARNAVRERYKIYQSEQKQQREKNLQAKTALCEQAELLLAEANIKEANKKFKELFTSWKTIGPIPKEVSNTLWQRFLESYKKFSELRKSFYEARAQNQVDNAAAKLDLCTTIEAALLRPNWLQLKDTIPRLKQRWRSLGLAPNEAELKARFMGACEQFYQKRSLLATQKQEEERANQAKKEALCEHLENLVTLSNLEDVDTEVEIENANQQWQNIGPTSKATFQSLRRRFFNACNALQRKYLEHTQLYLSNQAAFENKLPIAQLLHNQSAGEKSRN